MNKLTLLFGVLCLVVVNARHYGDRDNKETLESEEETLKRPREHNSEARHRRRRWQMNYGYDYSPPNYYYPDRRDNRNEQQVLQQILAALDEISAYIRRPPIPPPLPQPIYIPYPVPYNPQIQHVPCTPTKTNDNTTTVSVDRRRGPGNKEETMDPNRIWGVAISKKDNDYDDEGDGSRPISFDPIVPKQLMKRPAPKVDHGSVQASMSTEPPRFSADTPDAPSVSFPGMCSAAVLSCCGMSNSKVQQKQCFTNIGCGDIYADGIACDSNSIQKALESFKVAYAPLN